MKVTYEGDIPCLELNEDIQGELVIHLENKLLELVNDNKTRITINMEKVGYIYSQGLGILIRYHKMLSSKGGGLYLFNIRKTVQRIFMETTVFTYLNVYTTREEMEFDLYTLEAGTQEISHELGLIFTVIEKDNHEAKVKLSGSIDSEKDYNCMRSGLTDLMKLGVIEIKADFSDLIFIDEPAVIELMGFSKRLKDLGGKLVLVAPMQMTIEQFDVMNVLDQLEIQEKIT